MSLIRVQPQLTRRLQPARGSNNPAAGGASTSRGLLSPRGGPSSKRRSSSVRALVAAVQPLQRLEDALRTLHFFYTLVKVGAMALKIKGEEPEPRRVRARMRQLAQQLFQEATLRSYTHYFRLVGLADRSQRRLARQVAAQQLGRDLAQLSVTLVMLALRATWVVAGGLRQVVHDNELETLPLALARGAGWLWDERERVAGEGARLVALLGRRVAQGWRQQVPKWRNIATLVWKSLSAYRAAKQQGPRGAAVLQALLDSSLLSPLGEARSP